MKELPKHVAIIMDGNGRWAEKKGLPKIAGHNQGMLAMKEIIKKSSVMGIKYLTVYAFSTENWKRSAEEVGGIFKLLVKFVGSELEELSENNVKVRVLGEYKEKVPFDAAEAIEKAIERTKDNTGLQFNIALNYGGRDEIIRAVKKLGDILTDGALSPDTICEKMFEKYLYTGNENGNIPDPDLIIRTSGEERLSNFMLWQAAYSELAFTDTLWPDYTPEEYEEMINEYMTRERRYGGR